MTRSLSIASLLAVVLPTASAQTVGPLCAPYTPSHEEVTVAISESREAVPSYATLLAACVVEDVRQVRPGVLENNDHHYLEFVWPTGAKVGESERWEKAECRRSPREEEVCQFRGRSLRTRFGDITLIGDDITDREIIEIRAFLKQRLKEDQPLRYIRRTEEPKRPDAWHDTEKFNVGAAQIAGSDMRGYELLRECAYAMCKWKVLRSYIDYPIRY